LPCHSLTLGYLQQPVSFIITYFAYIMAFRRTIAAIAALSSIVVPSAALDVDLKTNLAIYWVCSFLLFYLSPCRVRFTDLLIGPRSLSTTSEPLL
jgi:hypothetical protein